MPSKNFLGCYARTGARLAALLTAGVFSHSRRRLIRKLDRLLSGELSSLTYWEYAEAEAYADRMDPALARYTSIYELAVISLLADRHKHQDTFLEIGTNEGRSTANFAAALPGWSIDTVDLPREMGSTVEDWQSIELLPASEIGKFCRHLPQVKVHCGHPAEILRGRRFGAVFVDGDHSYEGVRRDTELALVIADGVIIWHDYRPWDERMGVPRYLDELRSLGVPWSVVPRTTVAYVPWVAGSVDLGRRPLSPGPG